MISGGTHDSGYIENELDESCPNKYRQVLCVVASDHREQKTYSIGAVMRSLHDIPASRYYNYMADIRISKYMIMRLTCDNLDTIVPQELVFERMTRAYKSKVWVSKIIGDRPIKPWMPIPIFYERIYDEITAKIEIIPTPTSHRDFIDYSINDISERFNIDKSAPIALMYVTATYLLKMPRMAKCKRSNLYSILPLMNDIIP